MHRILIVEDDPVISKAIERELVKWSYTVRNCQDFSQVLKEYVQFAPDLLLLDVSLPFYNGYHWCQEIRRISNLPILFISSKNQPMDIVMSITMGADDFVTKPFDMSVLVAKIQSLLRRSYAFAAACEWLEYEGVRLNLKSALIQYQDQQIDLTKNEFQIARILFEQRGQFVSRDQMMRALWDTEWFVDDNTLTVNVARLRKKLEEHGIAPLITTKKGLGYGLVIE